MSARVQHGQRRVVVTPEVFEAWLVNENRVTTNLPEDARFVDLWPPDSASRNGTYTLLFESKEWDELAEGEDIPKLTPEVERYE